VENCRLFGCFLFLFVIAREIKSKKQSPRREFTKNEELQTLRERFNGAVEQFVS
jgi:hypothetical protein